MLDCGDTIQGTPLAYYHCRINNTPADPTILAMNTLGYDAMVIGNHEYNFGLAVLNKARHEANFPWLSANTYRASTNETAYQPGKSSEIQDEFIYTKKQDHLKKEFQVAGVPDRA